MNPAQESKTRQNLLGFAEGPVFASPEDLNTNRLKEERVMQLANAKVMFANYALLQNDFPQLHDAELARSHAPLSVVTGARRSAMIRSLIDAWVLKHVAFMSKPQVAQSVVNTKIAVTEKTTKAIRPRNYGRALVFAVKKNKRHLGPDGFPELDPEGNAGLLDVKGVGVAPNKTPRHSAHANGLMNGEDCITELMFEQLINRIFRNEGVPHTTVPIYALIDPGFNCIDKHGAQFPAGILARRAHKRPHGGGDLPNYGTPEQIAKIEIELLLRKYGITSTNNGTQIGICLENGEIEVHYNKTLIDLEKPEVIEILKKVSRFSGQPLLFDGINVQITRNLKKDPLEATLVDFGHYRVREDFSNPLLSLVDDRTLRWGGSIWPDDEIYQVPVAKLRVPQELWGGQGSVFGYPEMEGKWRPYALGRGLAVDFRAGNLSGEDVLEKIDEYITTVTDKWV